MILPLEKNQFSYRKYRITKPLSPWITFPWTNNIDKGDFPFLVLKTSVTPYTSLLIYPKHLCLILGMEGTNKCLSYICSFCCPQTTRESHRLTYTYAFLSTHAYTPLLLCLCLCLSPSLPTHTRMEDIKHQHFERWAEAEEPREKDWSRA